MYCYFIVTIQDNVDNTMYQSYIRKVKPIVEKFGGSYLVRTNEIIALSKAWIPKRLIIIRFPSRESLEQCFSSPEYEAIRSMRELSVDSKAVIVDGLPHSDNI